MADLPPPPEGRFGQWAYLLWDYVAKNRAAFANARISGTSPITVSSSGTSSFAISHATSGVAAGTYGGTNIFFRGVVDARGHLTGATAGNTAGPFAFIPSLVAVGAISGTTTTGTLTAAQTLVSVGWVTGTTTTGTLTAAYGGTMIGAGDLLGTSTTNTFTGALSTTGVSAGTYGAATIIPQFVVDAKGRFTSATQAGTLGTFAGFNSLVAAGIVTGTTTTGTLTTARTLVSVGAVTGTTTTGTLTTAQTLVLAGYVTGTSATGTLTAGYAGTLVGAGDVLGTSTTSTFTGALSTTGVTAGTYGAGFIVPQFVVDAKGRFTSATQAGTLGTFAGFNSFVVTGAVTGTTTTGTLTAASAGTIVAVGFVTGTTTTGTLTTVVQTGTIAVGGVTSTRGINAAIGSSTTLAAVMIAPYVDGNPVSLTTVAGTFMKYAVPASALAGSGQALRWNMWGTSQAGLAAGGRFALQFGTATIAVATTTNLGAWKAWGEMISQSNAAQEFNSVVACIAGGTQAIWQIDVGTLGMNLSTVTTLCWVGTGTLANNTRQQRGMIINFFGLQ